MIQTSKNGPTIVSKWCQTNGFSELRKTANNLFQYQIIQMIVKYQTQLLKGVRWQCAAASGMKEQISRSSTQQSAPTPMAALLLQYQMTSQCPVAAQTLDASQAARAQPSEQGLAEISQKMCNISRVMSANCTPEKKKCSPVKNYMQRIVAGQAAPPLTGK